MSSPEDSAPSTAPFTAGTLLTMSPNTEDYYQLEEDDIEVSGDIAKLTGTAQGQSEVYLKA